MLLSLFLFDTERIFFHFGNFCIIAKSLRDLKALFFILWGALCWILTCRFIFTDLTGKHYSDDGTNIEISPSTVAKIYLFLLTFLSNYVSQVLANTSWHYSLSLVKKEWLPIDLKAKNIITLRLVFFRSLPVEFVVNFLIYFLIFFVIGVESFSNIPNLREDFTILIFGYLFPFIKALVVSVCYNACILFSDSQEWTQEYTSKMTYAFSSAGVIVCTLSQLYIVFRSANDYYFFIYQYIPHEIIKKLSWLTFHPLYLKIKIQVVHIVSLSLKSVFQIKSRVDPLQAKRESKRRFTKVVLLGLDATAGEIIGRQFGEDICMILIAIWMLPICQEYLFTQIYQNSSSSSSLPFPSYNDILTMIVGTAYGLETILTIFCFVILQRVGIPLASNTQVLEFNLLTFGFNAFIISAFCIVLVAAISAFD